MGQGAPILFIAMLSHSFPVVDVTLMAAVLWHFILQALIWRRIQQDKGRRYGSQGTAENIVHISQEPTPLIVERDAFIEEQSHLSPGTASNI